MLNSVDWQTIAYYILAGSLACPHGYIPNTLPQDEIHIFPPSTCQKVVVDSAETFDNQGFVKQSAGISFVAIG